MPIPSGTYPIGGPILDISGGPLTPSAALRTAGVVALRGGKVTRVNAAGDGWEEVPGHVIAATAPTEVFEGQLWYDTTAAALKHYNGTAFVAVAGSSTAIADLAVTTAKLADLSVTTAKLAADAVTPAKLDAGNDTKRLNLRTRLACRCSGVSRFYRHADRSDSSLGGERYTSRHQEIRRRQRRRWTCGRRCHDGETGCQCGDSGEDPKRSRNRRRTRYELGRN